MGPYTTPRQHSPANKVVLFGSGNGSKDLYKLDADGQDQRAQAGAGRDGIKPPPWRTIDPVSGELLVLYKNETFYSFNPATDTWKEISVEGMPAALKGNEAIATPIASPRCDALHDGTAQKGLRSVSTSTPPARTDISTTRFWSWRRRRFEQLRLQCFQPFELLVALASLHAKMLAAPASSLLVRRPGRLLLPAEAKPFGQGIRTLRRVGLELAGLMPSLSARRFCRRRRRPQPFAIAVQRVGRHWQRGLALAA